MKWGGLFFGVGGAGLEHSLSPASLAFALRLRFINEIASKSLRMCLDQVTNNFLPHAESEGLDSTIVASPGGEIDQTNQEELYITRNT